MRQEFGTFSLDVSKRILDILCNIELNRTNLASMSRINYNALVRYLNMLTTLGWIRMTERGTVAITPLGLEARKRLHNLPSNELERSAENDVSLIGSVGKKLALIDSTAKTLQVSRGEQNKSFRHMTGSSGKQDRIYNVMIVDDEPEIGLTYKMFLKSTGRYRVDTFTEPALALKDFANDPEKYDLVVLDIRMPGINGLRLYQSMSAMSRECRFLFISALDAANELLSIFPNIQPEHIIRKPIGKDGFIKAVDSQFVVN